MHLREVHIDGFGIFHDKSVTGFTNGLNVLYGPNEKGKSTLLAFIIRCLFGYPRGSISTNSYPALAGGAYGGRLICTLDNNDELIVTRTEGSHGGRLEALCGNRTINHQQALGELLGNITRNLYGNVYAIGLSELQEIKSLDNDEVRDRLYGAELGLGGTSISEIRLRFEKDANIQFKQRGSSQVISRTYREIETLRTSIRKLQEELASYDQYCSNRDHLQLRINKLDTQITAKTRTRRTLELQKNQYSEFVSYMAAKDKHKAIPDLGKFHETVIAQLDECKKVVDETDSDVKNKSTKVEGLKVHLESFSDIEDLTAKEASINSLSRMSDKYQSALDDLSGVKQTRASKEKNIQNRISLLGSSLTVQSVKDYTITAAEEEKLETLTTQISNIRINISEVDNKLDLHELNSATKAGSRLEGPRTYKLGVMLIEFLAVVGFILGLIQTNLWLSGVSLLSGVMAGLLLTRLRWGKPLLINDALERKLMASKVEAEEILRKLETRWSRFLTDLGLPNDLGPSKAKEVLAEIMHLQSEIESLHEYDQRIIAMQSTIESGDTQYSAILPFFESTQLSGNLIADIPVISGELELQKNQKRLIGELTDKLRTSEIELNAFKENAAAAQEKLAQLIANYDAVDEADLRTKGDLFAQRRSLQSDIDKAQHIIQSSAGIGDEFNAFVSSIKELSLEKISYDLDYETNSIEQLQAERDRINQEIGSLTSKIEGLSSNTELLDLQMTMETKLEQLQRSGAIWIKSQIALAMLDASLAIYEETRQPEVIRFASNVFSTITGGTYTRVIKPLQKLELEVFDETLQKRKVSQLSRGTVEQLYLAMCMGLIENYEQHSERMPVILDDVLVNFDDERAVNTAHAISTFAENRQIIALTCHEESRDRLIHAGGNLVEF